MKVGVIFGGVSSEHDVSIITGVMTLNAVNVKHKGVGIYIDGNGEFFIGRDFDKIETFNKKDYKKKRIHFMPSKSGIFSDSGRVLHNLDAVIICTHGINGEDGAMASLLNLTSIPYSGSGILASSIAMDKVMQKRVYRDFGLNVTKFIELNKYELEGEFFDLVSKINNNLTFPLFVKPSSLGSSIGIGKANDFKELFLRLDEGFEWDNKLIIEEAIEDFIEVNCAVLGYADRLIVSEIEQPISNGFLSYDDKYSVSGLKGETGRYLPAQIEPSMKEQVISTAKQVFMLLGCSGVARIDFLIKDETLYVNEINTVPGSMSSYLFSFNGIEFPLLIDKLLDCAFLEKKQKQSLKYAFDSNILKLNSLNSFKKL